MVPPNDDYDPRQSIQELSANLTQPDKFAEIFCNAAKTQKKIDDVIKENIREMLRKDYSVINDVKKIVMDSNKEDRWLIFNKVGLAAWSILLIVITALATAWATGVFGHKPQ
jgi:hypothetical protein